MALQGLSAAFHKATPGTPRTSQGASKDIKGRPWTALAIAEKLSNTIGFTHIPNPAALMADCIWFSRAWADPEPCNDTPRSTQ